MKKSISLLLALMLTISCLVIPVTSSAKDVADPTVYPEPTRSIKYQTPRCQGDDVKWLQAMLYQLGYSIDVDGSFGKGSEAVVKSFQIDNGLTVDGSVGPATRNMLKEKYSLLNENELPETNDFENPDKYPCPTRSLKYQTPRCQGDDVKWLQSVLKQLGYSVDVDGSFGKRTEAVVKKFQRDNGLSTDGSVGTATRSMLVELWSELKDNLKPTAEPTIEPTGAPTVEPTSEPTPEPTAIPEVGEYFTFGYYEQDNDLENGKEPIE